MTISSRYALEALTRYNYFPNQRNLETELPPIFSSKRFTPEVAKLLADVNDNRCQKKGYDLVNYSLTRFNNVPRALGICHPKPYSNLIAKIEGFWDELAGYMENDFSFIRPSKHQDGRLVVMNYGGEKIEQDLDIVEGFSKRFMVKADIANCFHSIYSHSISWAVLGLTEGKKVGRNHWTSKLDKEIASLKRDETVGIPIGPAISNIVVEIVLGAVDEKLKDLGYKYSRYIDDYKCFCSTEEEAQKFIRNLQQELSEYRLTLNLSKTKVIALPNPINDDWVNILKINAPTFCQQVGATSEIGADQAISYLDYAVNLNKSTPDGSVLKFALRNIIARLDWKANRSVLSYTLNLSWHFPALIPLLDRLLGQECVSACEYEIQINELLIENCKVSDHSVLRLRHIAQIRR